MEEVADILEVLEAICNINDYKLKDIAKPQEIGTCYAITNNYGKHLYLLYKNENIQSSDCTYFLWSCYILKIKKQKKKVNGGFNNKIFLEKITN